MNRVLGVGAAFLLLASCQCASLPTNRIYSCGTNDDCGRLGPGFAGLVCLNGICAEPGSLDGGGADAGADSGASSDGSVSDAGVSDGGASDAGQGCTGALPCNVGSCPVVALAAGSVHTCAVLAGGSVACWGRNTEGELGSPDAGSGTSTPVGVCGIAAGATLVAGGDSFSCAAVSSGGALCWGYNGYGQLGNGTTGPPGGAPLPGDVLNLSTPLVALVAGISPSGGFVCSALMDGGMSCWGDNHGDQIGNPGAGSIVKTPVDVVGLPSPVTAVAVGSLFTCGLLQGGAVACWGDNSNGELGNPDAGSFTPTPTAVTGLSSGVLSVSAAGDHACAVESDGGVVCWGGFNDHGQLGLLGPSDGGIAATPVTIPGFASPATAVAVGYGFACVRNALSGVQCWGEGNAGQLGNAANADSPSPVDVVGLTGGVVSLAAGGQHACALLTDAGVACWGENGDGQLGAGFSGGTQSTPVPVQL